MNYIGSKIKLSSFIYDTITNVAGENLSGTTFCDLFAGTGAVSKIFQGKADKIINNDREYYSYVLNRAYLQGTNAIDDTSFFDLLNQSKGYPGFIFNEYSQNGKAGRLYFSQNNGLKIDAMRQMIGHWKNKGCIDERQYYHLLASLIYSADKVANTACVYSAYLKRLKTTATKKLVIKPLEVADPVKSDLFNEDSNCLIRKIKGDILYLDPPYNGREYAANYHLLNTIARYENNWVPTGKTGVRPYKTSLYCKVKEAAKALTDLIENADFKYVFLSYNNEGIIPYDYIGETMAKFGNYTVASISYPRFNTRKRQATLTTTEYIHILER